MIRYYRHSGMTIASTFAVPEWDAFACEGGRPVDVTLEVSDTLLDQGCDADATAFAVEGVGRFLIREGAHITVQPDHAVDPAHWRVFVLGSAWGHLGYQRGLAMWHASAAARGGRAVLVCGASGAGKSTMAATLVARGAQLVADDLARIDPQGGAAFVHPSAIRLKLWREAIAWLGWDERIVQADWFRADKFHCAIPEHAPAEPACPLAAIVVLEEGPEPRLTRLSGAEALAAVMGATVYRPQAIDQLGAWPRQGALAAKILSAVPAFRLARPRDLARSGEAAALIESLWER